MEHERSWALVAALCVTVFASVASAQRSGEIRGRVRNGVTGDGLGTVVIVARSPSAIGDQFGFTEEDGSFLIPLLPPGTYTMSLERDGFRSRSVQNVRVELGRTTPFDVELLPTEIEVAPIVVTAPEASAIDRGSFETGTNLNREYYRNVPSGRRYTEILRDTPGSVQDDVGTSVFGSTGVENTYIIEGLNTTDVGFGRAATDLNVDFFEEVEMKTGGYMPEFGRSTGGIFNLVLRGGGNEFHGDVFINASPGFLRATPETIYRAGESIGREDVPTLTLDAGFAIGGPIIKDRLWFFAGFNPTMTFTDVSRIYQSRYDDDGDGNPDLDELGNTAVREVGRDHLDRTVLAWQFAGKLELAIDENNHVGLSYFGNPGSINGVIRPIGESLSNNGVNGSSDYYNGERLNGSHNVILNYAGQFFDRHLRFEAFVGYHTQRDVQRNSSDQPVQEILHEVALDTLEPGNCPENPGLSFVQCGVSDYQNNGTGFYYDEQLDRYTGGFRLTHLVQNHQVRWGAEAEWKAYHSTRGYSGGYFGLEYAPDSTDPYSFERDYFARVDDGGNTVLLDTPGAGNDPDPFTADVGTLTTTLYLQDLWEVNEYLTVGGGVRWDLEQMRDTQGSSPLTIPDEIAPRLGASFDPTGRGRSRIYASYGWFFESMPLDAAQRSFSAEGTAIRYVDGTSVIDESAEFICFDVDGNPVPRAADGTCPPDTTEDPYGVLGGENSPVANGLGGQYHDEFVLGAEYEVMEGWTVGVSGVARRLQRAIEDISPDDGNTYFIANPGENDCDVAMEFRDALTDYCSNDRNGDGSFTPDEYDPTKTVFPKPIRLYEGLVLMTRRRLSDHLQFLASYTLSQLVGNYPGLYSPDNGQLDPNISSQYDLPDLVANRYGLLPQNHTHVFKVAGSYELGGLTPSLAGLTLGLRFEVASGTPINYLGRHQVYGRREVFVLPRGAGGETPPVSQIDLFVGYDIKLPADMTLNFNVTIFNLFNFQEVTAVNQEYTTDVMLPYPDGTPLESMTNIDGNPVTVNSTFGQPTARQAPLNVRLGARLSF